ncbi:hypothetical protein HYT02_00750 [Candidatus Gottesmanbacteria bacterium]|nr:hypothetical protein [Candidatus Gottesmanbacteria bacterium]
MRNSEYSQPNFHEAPLNPVDSIGIIGANGQVGTMLKQQMRTIPHHPAVYSVGRGDIEGLMASRPKYVIAATPKQATKEVLEEIVFYVKSPFTAFLFQNGVGVTDEAKRILQKCPVDHSLIRGSLYTTVHREGNNVEYNRKKLRLALYPVYIHESRLVEQAVGTFEDAGFNVKEFDDPESGEWTKLLANSIGSTSTVTGLTPFETFSDPLLFDIELRGLAERLAIIKARGTQLLDLSWAQTGLIKKAAEFPQELLHFLRSPVASVIATKRGNLPSSAARKIASGESPEEALYYHLPFVEEAQRLGLPAVVDTTLARFIQYHLDGYQNLDFPKNVRRARLIESINQYG